MDRVERVLSTSTHKNLDGEREKNIEEKTFFFLEQTTTTETQ